jgi:hypothetical protein
MSTVFLLYLSLYSLSLEDTQQKCCFGTSICDTISERFHASYYEIQTSHDIFFTCLENFVNWNHLTRYNTDDAAEKSAEYEENCLENVKICAKAFYFYHREE